MEGAAIRRALIFNRGFLPDSTNGAAVASRALLGCLARHGFRVEALCGSLIDGGPESDPADVLAERGLPFNLGGVGTAGSPGVDDAAAPVLRFEAQGIPVTLPHRRLRRDQRLDPRELGESFQLFEALFSRHRPDILVTYGGDPLTREILRRARHRGVATVFTLHNFGYLNPSPFADADVVLVPSRFAAHYYREALGLNCTVLPNLVDWPRACVERHEPRYLTFVNPSPEKGVWAFARIADELGRRRPDIPILVVESRGTEADVAACGLDLRAHSNVFFMPHTPDPRRFYRVSRIVLMPSVWWENQPRVAVEAMVNGIPVIGSDRGGIPEALGRSGISLPLPQRMTPAARLLPTPEEVLPWVDAIVRLWDDEPFYDELRRRALVESERWNLNIINKEYIKFFENLM
jgi:glycosyltransferase involved in cell wall biosynthesis